MAAAVWYLCENEYEETERGRSRRPYKRRHERKYWLHNVMRNRRELREFHHIILELRGGPGHFRQYFRMLTSEFDTLTNTIGPQIAKLNKWLCLGVRGSAWLKCHVTDPGRPGGVPSFRRIFQYTWMC